MKALRFALVALSRDWKSGELAVLLEVLVIAVAALTGVGFFTDRVGQAVAQQAAEVIAADLRLQGSQPPSEDYVAAARERGLATARTLSFPTVVFFGEDSTLAAIRAVSEGYPLRGRVRIADVPFGPARETTGIPARGPSLARLRQGEGRAIDRHRRGRRRRFDRGLSSAGEQAQSLFCSRRAAVGAGACSPFMISTKACSASSAVCSSIPATRT